MRFATLILLLWLTTLAGCDSPEIEKAAELNRKGLAFAANGKKELALKYYHAACGIKEIPDSNRCAYLANIAVEYWFDQVDSASFYFKKAAQLSEPASYKWLYYMANVYVLKTEIDSAITLLLRAYQIDSVNMLANNLLGLIYLGDFGSDYEDVKKALKYNQRSYIAFKDIRSSSVLARNYYQLNMMQNALALFKSASERAPGKTSYLKTLVMVEEEMGLKQEADSLLLELKQKDSVRYNQVIDADIRVGQHTIYWPHVGKNGG